jgi:ABC-type hemin transport system ATPase subunit
MRQARLVVVELGAQVCRAFYRAFAFDDQRVELTFHLKVRRVVRMGSFPLLGHAVRGRFVGQRSSPATPLDA